MRGASVSRARASLLPALEFILWRLLRALPQILLVALGTFVLLWLAPGNTAEALLGDTRGADPAFVARLHARYGLDQSFASQLWHYLARLARFDFGWSFVHDQPLSRVLLDRLGTTLLLTGGALCLSFALGSVLGTFAARRARSPLDHLLRGFAFLFHAMPSYFLGLVLIAVFALELGWLPAGAPEPSASTRTGTAHALEVARHLVMPMTTLVLIYTALYVRLMRASVLQVASRNHVRTARAKGVEGARLTRHHIVRNALLPLVARLGLQFSTLLGSSVVVEVLFGLPGLGQLAYRSVQRQELHTLMGVIVLCALVVIIVSLLIDLLHAALDARTRHR